MCLLNSSLVNNGNKLCLHDDMMYSSDMLMGLMCQRLLLLLQVTGLQVFGQFTVADITNTPCLGLL